MIKCTNDPIIKPSSPAATNRSRMEDDDLAESVNGERSAVSGER